MRGNVYICLEDATFNSLIPDELVSAYGIPKYDDEGTQTEVTHPTFKEMAENNVVQFGEVVEIEINESKYHIVEIEASWLEGELSSLLKLGQGKSFPKNSLMTRSEASKFISDNQPEDE